jgi:hypothetical protein
MSRGFVIVCVALAACLPEPTFRPRDAATDAPSPDAALGDPLTPVPEVRAFPPNAQGQVEVSGPYFGVRFSNTGARYPLQLDIADADGNAANFLGGPSTEACNDERGVGIGLYPIDRVNSIDQNVGSASAMPSLAGAAVAQVSIRWNEGFCTNTLAIDGESLFTFFPDGRMHRFDQLDITTMQTVTPDCTCSQPTSRFFFTSYASLNYGVIASLESPVGTITPLPMTGGEVTDTMDRICASGFGGRKLAFGFEALVRPARIRRVNNNTNIAIVKDWLDDTTGQSITGPLMLTMATTHLLDRTQTCSALFDRLDALAASNTIIATHGDATTPLTIDRHDGMYGTAQPITETLVVLRAGGANIPGGFAVKLQFEGEREFAVYRTGATDNGGGVQPVVPGNTAVVMWFREGLGQDQTIVVSAPRMR